MNRSRQATATAVLAGMLTACMSAPPTRIIGAAARTPATPPAASTPPTVTTPGPSRPLQDRHGGSHRGGGLDAGTPAVGPPAGFPAELPIPAGTVQSSTEAAGRWSMSILAAGSAPDVKRAMVQLYTAHGFSTDAPDAIPVTLKDGRYTVSVLVENYDHSAVETLLSLNVTPN